MFRYLRRALYRNRKKLLGTAVAVTAGGYLVKKKMGEYLERKMQQMKQAQLEMKQRNYHKDTVVVCEKAVTSLVRDLRNEIFNTLSIPSKQELQNGSKEEKLLSWDLFKMNCESLPPFFFFLLLLSTNSLFPLSHSLFSSLPFVSFVVPDVWLFSRSQQQQKKKKKRLRG